MTETLTMNPFKQIRQAAGMTQSAWAMALGVAGSVVVSAESGHAVTPRTLIRALGRQGHDVYELEMAYTAWRRSHGTLGSMGGARIAANHGDSL